MSFAIQCARVFHIACATEDTSTCRFNLVFLGCSPGGLAVACLPPPDALGRERTRAHGTRSVHPLGTAASPSPIGRLLMEHRHSGAQRSTRRSSAASQRLALRPWRLHPAHPGPASGSPRNGHRRQDIFRGTVYRPPCQRHRRQRGGLVRVKRALRFAGAYKRAAVPSNARGETSSTPARTRVSFLNTRRNHDSAGARWGRARADMAALLKRSVKGAFFSFCTTL